MSFPQGSIHLPHMKHMSLIAACIHKDSSSTCPCHLCRNNSSMRWVCLCCLDNTHSLHTSRMTHQNQLHILVHTDHIHSHHCCISNNSVKTIFVVTKDLTQEHLVNHIILNLSSVIGKYSEIINFSLDGTANSIPEIKEYLQV